jgi:hypothetical protein
MCELSTADACSRSETSSVDCSHVTLSERPKRSGFITAIHLVGQLDLFGSLDSGSKCDMLFGWSIGN